ncbi:UrcA family protein [Erythrobacter sp. HKB08]|uniref:UrcA family protein n=1 Tax=Erythrobacter sp. HKB08 TaxID=2502843 RepID=UPI00100930A8|nr:UrcA family protein [Erythrobacter sp. HKB08]
MTKTFVIAAAAIAALATPAAAMDAPVASVDMSDLDLTQEADRDVLDQRIDRAIRNACRVRGFDAVSRKAEQRCMTAMQAEIAPKVAIAIDEARTGRLAAITLDPRG